MDGVSMNSGKARLPAWTLKTAAALAAAAALSGCVVYPSAYGDGYGRYGYYYAAPAYVAPTYVAPTVVVGGGWGWGWGWGGRHWR